MEPLEQRVLHFVQEQHLIPGPSHLLVAVSGGPDSVCLLHILVTLQAKLDIKLAVAHLNHQLRGTEADADAEYVGKLARELGLPATIEKRDVKSYQAQHHLSLEEAAREVRYTFLAEVARSTGAERVAVGHTRDDHIETVLMHLIRGTGTRGLRGLQPHHEWQLSGNVLTVIRPLLPVSREETARYCHEHQLKPRLDTSNLSLSPLRNRIRHELLPRLQSYNPQIREALLRTAAIASGDIAFIDEASTRLWNEVAQWKGSTIVLAKEQFLQLPTAIQRTLLRTALEKLLANPRDIEMRHIAELMAALSKPAGKRISLPGGLDFSVEYGRYLLSRDPAALSPFPPLEGEFNLTVPGETRLPGWLVKADFLFRQPLPESTDNFVAHFDLDMAGKELTVRTRRPGDRFPPLGMSQPKKVGEFMVDAKIPHAWRERIPVVCSPEQIIWLVGYRISERVKVTEKTQQILRLKFERD